MNRKQHRLLIPNSIAALNGEAEAARHKPLIDTFVDHQQLVDRIFLVGR